MAQNYCSTCGAISHARILDSYNSVVGYAERLVKRIYACVRWLALAFAITAMSATMLLAQNAVPADIKDPTDSLLQKLAALNDAQKTAIRADANIIKSLDALMASIQAIESATDANRAEAAATRLTTLLSDGRFSDKEKLALPAGAGIKALTVALKQLAGEIHVGVVRASYGDHKTRRTCDATAFFRANCLDKSKCPEPAGISGDSLCGYEPAPLAKDGANAALVYYTCGKSDVKKITLRGKAQIVCTP